MDAITKQLRLLKEKDPKKFAEALLQMSDKEVEAILYDWNIWGRENQLSPNHKQWRIWLILAGRGLKYRLTLNLSNSVNFF